MTDKINKPMSEATLQERREKAHSERETEKRQREEEDDVDGSAELADAGLATKRQELDPSVEEARASMDEAIALATTSDEANDAHDDSKSTTHAEKLNDETSVEKPSSTSQETKAVEKKAAVASDADKSLRDASESATATETIKAGHSASTTGSENKPADVSVKPAEPIASPFTESAQPRLGFGRASGFGSATGFASAPAPAPDSSQGGFSFGRNAGAASSGGFGSLLQTGTSTFGSLLDKPREEGEAGAEDDETAVDEEQYVAVRGLERTTVPTGEEGERCLHSVKAKLYAINPEAATEGWKERGVGTLRVLEATVDADDSGREATKTATKQGCRLVMRADAVLRVILNMPLRSGYKLEEGGEALGEKTLKVFGVEEGRGVWLALRVGSKTACVELQSVLASCLERDKKDKNKKQQLAAEEEDEQHP